jgi:hypothetical protein
MFRQRHFRQRHFNQRHFDKTSVAPPAPTLGEGIRGGDVGTGPDYSKVTVKGFAGPQRRPRLLVPMPDLCEEEDEELLLVLMALLR